MRSDPDERQAKPAANPFFLSRYATTMIFSQMAGRVQKSKNLHHRNRLAKRRIFERTCPDRKSSPKNGVNRSQNPFLISPSQKARVRLSFERVRGDKTDKDCSHCCAVEAATSAGCTEGRAVAIIRCRRDRVETDADRLRSGFDGRSESRLAARRADRSGVRQDFDRADVGCGYRPPRFA
jgi:hypothetical protein